MEPQGYVRTVHMYVRAVIITSKKVKSLFSDMIISDPIFQTRCLWGERCVIHITKTARFEARFLSVRGPTCLD